MIHDYALLRLHGYDGVVSKGAKKSLTDKTFVAGVLSDEVSDDCNRTGLRLEKLKSFIIAKKAAEK